MFGTGFPEASTTSIRVFTQIGLVLLVAAVVIWAVFFSTYPPVHDLFHELRHSLYVIACH